MNKLGRLVIILNGISRNKKKFYKEILPGISTQYAVDVVETKHREHAVELAYEALPSKPNGILAAGGDGTLNQVLNGMMKAGQSIELPPLGIIPLGTGNDFARMEKIIATSKSILEKLEGGGKATDVGRINCRDEYGGKITRYFINVASLGMGPDVVRRLYKSDRGLGPTLTYLKAITQTFFSHRPEAVEIKTDDWKWSGKLRVFAIGNGQSFGSGLYVSPEAKPDDGMFNTFIAGEIKLFKFLLLLQKIKSTKKIIDDRIMYNLCQSLSLSSSSKCWIETEGELCGLLPAQVNMLPKAIKFFR